MPRFRPTGRHLRFALAVLVLPAVTACSARTADRGAPPPVANQLTATDLQLHADATTLHRAIRRLRPGFLEDRRSVTRHAPTLVLDGVVHADLEVLHSVPTGSVVLVRYLEGYEARTRWGNRVPGAVLDVVTVRQPGARG